MRPIARTLVAVVSRPPHLVRGLFRRHPRDGWHRAASSRRGAGTCSSSCRVTNTRGEPLFEAVRALSRDGVNINMTAIFTSEQVARAVDALAGGAPACVSVFAGRLADFGVDYRPIVRDAVTRARRTPNV